MNYYERHIGDYLKDTAHLSLLEHGVYGRLLDVYYTRECALPAEQVERLVGAKSKDERSALQSVLAEFFDLRGGCWNHGRCEAEIARYQDKQRKASASANVRWSNRKSHSEGNANASPNAMRTHSEGNALQTPDTRHQTEDKYQPADAGSSVSPPATPTAPGPSLTLVTPEQPPSKGLPDCPHRALLALWAEVLPAMPQHNAELWRGARASHLRARWRETAAAKNWTSESDGLTYFRRLFAYVGQSAFLTGRARSTDGRPAFVAELAWLVKPENWAKTIEGKYHAEAA